MDELNRDLDRNNVISIISSADDKNVKLRITDYQYDLNLRNVIIAAIYDNKSVILELCDKVLDSKKYPDSFGKRYFEIDDHVFFIDDASDIAGLFDNERMNKLEKTFSERMEGDKQ